MYWLLPPSASLCKFLLHLDLNLLCSLIHTRQLISPERVLYAVCLLCGLLDSAPPHLEPEFFLFILQPLEPSWESLCTHCNHRVWHTVGINTWFWKEPTHLLDECCGSFVAVERDFPTLLCSLEAPRAWRPRLRLRFWLSLVALALRPMGWLTKPKVKLRV